MNWGIPNEIIAALLGAVAVGLLTALDRVIERGRRKEAMLTAIAAEVRSICDLIKHQQYLDGFSKLAQDIRENKWDGTKLIIDVRSDYFSVFESTCSDIGILSRKHVPHIVVFYAYAKSAIDSTRPDGPDSEKKYEAANIISVEGLLMAILALGAKIEAFPKKALPDLDLDQ